MSRTSFNFLAAAITTPLLLLGSHAALAQSTIYVTRHAEDMVELMELEPGVFEQKCAVNDETDAECCIEPLNELGKKRAEGLAEWFARYHITDRVTHVIASHKTRTQATVAQIAEEANVTLQRIPDEADCEPRLESSGASKDPMVDYILHDLPPRSTLVVGAHSGTIYKIFEDLGIDTTRDPKTFPRSSSGKVAGHKNLWKLRVSANGDVRLLRHYVLDLGLVRQRARRHEN